MQKKNNDGCLKPFAWVLVVAMALLCVLLIIRKKKVPEREEQIEEPLMVSAIEIQARDARDRLTLPGRVKADVSALLSAEQEGRVVEILVKKGDKVKQGDLLLQVDDRTFKLLAEAAEIELREASKDLKRFKELQKAGAVSGSNFDTKQIRVDNARIAFDSANIMVEKCAIRSPVDGFVDDRFIEVGEYAGMATPVLAVVQLDPVKVSFAIPERFIGALEVGTLVEFDCAALPDQTFTGTVTFLSQSAHEANNAFQVELELPNSEGLLRPGMIARIHLQLHVLKQAVIVPLSAVIPQKGEHIVFVAADGLAVRRTIRLYRLLGKEAIVESGLESGDLLVVDGHRGLVDGQPVIISKKP